jgi:hypothetical protein
MRRRRGEVASGEAPAGDALREGERGRGEVGGVEEPAVGDALAVLVEVLVGADRAPEGLGGEGALLQVARIDILGGGAVEGDEVGLLLDGEVEGGDVAEAGEDLGMLAYILEVELVEHAGGAGAADDAEDALDGGIAPGVHDAGGAGVVRAGEESPRLADVGGAADVEAHGG